MAQQVLDLFEQTNPACNPFQNIIMDGTVGGGGHARHVLERLSRRGELVCFDRDPKALQTAEAALAEDVRLRFIHDSYALANVYLEPLSVCAILLDLGVSTDQLGPEQGFSHQYDSALDMRFDPAISNSAYEVVNHYPVERLREIFFKYGEEPLAPRIARSLAQARMQGLISTTGQLARIIRAAVPERFQMKALARIFQAIRIEVNQEIEHLERGLPACWQVLKVGGVFCILSYHSLEDRRVKRFFAEKSKGCICPPRLPICACGKKSSAQILTPSPIRPTPKEIRLNSASRSAKLRGVLKTGRD